MSSYQRVNCHPLGFHSLFTWVLFRGSAVSHVVFTADVHGLLSEGQLSATWFSQLMYLVCCQRVSCQPRGFHSWYTWVLIRGLAVSHVVFTADVHEFLWEGQLSSTRFSQFIYLVRGLAVSHVVFTADEHGLFQLSATWFSQLTYRGYCQRVSCLLRGFHSWFTWVIVRGSDDNSCCRNVMQRKFSLSLQRFGLRETWQDPAIWLATYPETILLFSSPTLTLFLSYSNSFPHLLLLFSSPDLTLFLS